MTHPGTPCPLCRGRDADADLLREQVWEDPLWRLTTATTGEVPGFSYLEPKRHVRYVHELDGQEARSFGPVLARASRAVRAGAGAELVYVYVFGGSLDHLHVHLAPHVPGGPLNDALVRGDLHEEQLPSGVVVQTSAQFPLRPATEMADVVRRVRSAASDGDPWALDVLARDGGTAVVRRARADDLPALVDLLVDDLLGAGREDPTDLGGYAAALDEIDRDPAHLLVVVEVEGSVVATLQLTVLPSLARQGARRGQLQAIRVHRDHRGTGLGSALVRWAVAEAGRRGCRLVQLTSDAQRPVAHAFYQRLGFVPSHVGLELELG